MTAPAPRIEPYRPGEPVDIGADAPVILLVDLDAHPDTSGRAIAAEVAGAEAVVEDDRGKPRLVGSDACCSVSHTDGWLAVALARGMSDIGLDIERADRRLPHPRRLAGRVLSADELSTLNELPAPDPSDDPAFRRALLVAWTRKEAILKATGEGLRRDLRTVDVRGNVVTVDGVAWRCDTQHWQDLIVSTVRPVQVD